MTNHSEPENVFWNSTESSLLVVDDKPENIKVVVNYLKDHNYITAIATSGEAAVKRAQLLKPDLILMDVMMPGIDGFETCLRLKKNPETQNIPIIFMTALADEVNMARGFEVGAVDYITKPIKKEELLARVNTHVEIQRYRNHLEDEVKKRTTRLQEKTAELKMANQHLHIIMESVPDPLVIYDTSFTVSYLNPAFTRVFGWTLPEVKGGTIPYIPEGNQFETDRIIKKTFETNYHLDFETVRSTKDGHQIDVIISLATMTDSGENVTGLIVNLRNITERKKLEAQLQKVQKLEAIGTLAGGIAHDFNNILSPILGYTELMMMDAEKESKLEKRLKGVNDAALRAKDLIQQILSCSKQITQDVYPLKLQPVLQEVLKLSRASIPTTIEIKHSISNRCGMIKADPTRIHQVALNLVTNAFHAMEHQGGLLTMTLEEVLLTSETLPSKELTPGPYACLTITDTGDGMDEKTRKKIFEPYYTTKKNGKGTGLGLSMVYGIVRNCHGAITVKSRVGQGAEFCVFFPVVTGTEQEIKQKTKPIKTGTENILLVDDEVSLLNITQLMLERLGYHVTSQDSSTEALSLFCQSPERFDLVITDMTMPQKTGEQLALEIKSIRPDIPILLCTGFSERISEGNLSEACIDHMLMKPISINQLAQTLRKLLDN